LGRGESLPRGKKRSANRSEWKGEGNKQGEVPEKKDHYRWGKSRKKTHGKKEGSLGGERSSFRKKGKKSRFRKGVIKVGRFLLSPDA